ncbi:MAG TPA: hypothetical protein VGJ05_03270 [Fimbriiglobus sp.]
MCITRQFARSVFAGLLVLGLADNCRGQVVISQYYEGTSNNKWIELFNAGPSSVNLSTVTAGVWSNANAEGYKSNTAPTSSFTLSGTLASGGIYLLSHPLATLPSYATANATSTSVIGFNGNDSFAIYAAGTFSTANVLDAIGFTNAGNEGMDKSFTRSSLTAGWNTTGGTNATSFSCKWLGVGPGRGAGNRRSIAR